MEFMLLSLIILGNANRLHVFNSVLGFYILEELSEHTDRVWVLYKAFVDNEDEELNQHHIFRFDLAVVAEYLSDSLLFVFWFGLEFPFLV